MIIFSVILLLFGIVTIVDFELHGGVGTERTIGLSLVVLSLMQMMMEVIKNAQNRAL